MIDAGILTGNDRVELVDGELLNMSLQGPERSALEDSMLPADP